MQKMASQTLKKSGTAIAAYSKNWSPSAFQARDVQTGATDAIKRGINEAKTTGECLKSNVASTAENVLDKTKETAQNVVEKAKQAGQEAWRSSKETAEKGKDIVIGNVELSKEELKDTVDMASRSMNTKNNPNC